MTLPRFAVGITRSRVSTAEVVGPTRFYVSNANGHADFRKAAGARRYAPTAGIRRYQPVVAVQAASPRRPAAPLRWAILAFRGLQMTRRGLARAMRVILHLLLDESATSSRSQRALTDTAIRHDMPIDLLPGYGSSDLS